MAKQNRPDRPLVFLSSTSEDLSTFRDKLRGAIKRLGMDYLDFEYNPARGDLPAYPECMRRVQEADVVVAIAAHWYGWVPEDQPAGDDGPGQKSITWLEAAEAWSTEGKIEVLGFVVEADAKTWPHRKEQDAFSELPFDDPDFGEKAQEIRRRMALLEDFKKEIGKYQRDAFTSEDDLAAKVTAALSDWQRRRGIAPEPTAQDVVDIKPYLDVLVSENGEIDIKGIRRAQKEATILPIVDLYTPLTYIERRPKGEEFESDARMPVVEGEARQPFEGKHGEGMSVEFERRIPLEKALLKGRGRILIIGEPGAGKSTFSRRLTYEAAAGMRSEPIPEDKRLLPNREPRFPILVKLGSLGAFIHEGRKRLSGQGVVDLDSPESLLLYLSVRTGGLNCPLPRDFIQSKLTEGALVILDGLDEAPEGVRGALVRLLEILPVSYPKSDIIVTSRPSAFGGVRQLKGFQSIEIAPLDDEGIDAFLQTWSACLRQDQPAQEAERQKLKNALANQDIQALARNPLMLTCLAVLCWNEVELPDRRAELYDLILTWLARQRKEKPGRPNWERCLQLHQQLALTMHTQPQGKQVELDAWAAIKALSGPREFRELADEDERRSAAERFLRDEENDSGIITGQDQKLRFWHQHFQEYLAAEALAGRDAQRRKLLLEQLRLYDPDWRETSLLVAGAMLKTAPGRLDDFLLEIIGTLPPKAPFTRRAPTLALIGAMLRDVYSSGYRFQDQALLELVEQTMQVFEPEAAVALDGRQRADAADAIGLMGDRRLGDSSENWIRIPAGEFWMGSQKERKGSTNYDPNAKDNETLHQVWVSGFEVGRFPVTVSEFAEFVQADGYQRREHWDAGGFGKYEAPHDWPVQSRYPSRPVTGVSWHEACAYAHSIGARLPTEAEWEKAVRSGRENAIYPWGSQQPDGSRANFGFNLGRPSPVGLYPGGTTAAGLADMAGNVWEWCSDWYGGDYYRASPPRDPPGPLEGDVRIVRGGSWVNDATFLRCAVRLRSGPDDGDDVIGFRCVREVFP